MIDTTDLCDVCQECSAAADTTKPAQRETYLTDDGETFSQTVYASGAVADDENGSTFCPACALSTENASENGCKRLSVVTL